MILQSACIFPDIYVNVNFEIYFTTFHFLFQLLLCSPKDLRLPLDILLLYSIIFIFHLSPSSVHSCTLIWEYRLTVHITFLCSHQQVLLPKYFSSCFSMSAAPPYTVAFLIDSLLHIFPKQSLPVFRLLILPLQESQHLLFLLCLQKPINTGSMTGICQCFHLLYT